MSELQNGVDNSSITENNVEALKVGDLSLKSEKDGASNGPLNGPKKSKKKKKKGAMDPAQLTPEYIAEQRALKMKMKEEKLLALIAQGVDPADIETPRDLRFIRREFLKIPHDNQDGGKFFEIDIMTYNLLAQALIRRKLFPTSGDALKWFKRSQVLLSEMKFYNSDVMCFQECDYIQFKTFWKPELGKLGYESKFHRDGDKNHGICILWKTEKFSCIDVSYILYDNESTGDIKPPTLSRNVALIVALQFSDSVLQQFPGTTKRGCLIGTTHMFWHPFGTFERTLQTYILLNKFKEFSHRVNVLQKTEENNWFNFFAGDFNSQPYDSPYLSIVRKPVYYDDRAAQVLAVSTSFQYSHLRGTGVEEDREENIELVGENQPKSPVPPPDFIITPEQQDLLDQILALHNSLDMRAISLYSVGYQSVHKENTDNDRGEPIFSNWAHAWRGLLDYILVVKRWDQSHNCQQVDKLTSFELENDMKLISLLKMPIPEEMGPEPSGQPRAGMYGSDHLCMVAKVGLRL